MSDHGYVTLRNLLHGTQIHTDINHLRRVVELAEREIQRLQRA